MPLCALCGSDTPIGVYQCAQCGAIVAPVMPNMPPSTVAGAAPSTKGPLCGLAVASLVMAFLGCLIVPSILAVIFGIVALVRIQKSGGRLAGQGLAIAGLVLGGLAVVVVPVYAAIMFPVFAKAHEKAQQAGCLANVKSLAMAVHMYARDYGERLPPGARWSDALLPYAKDAHTYICPSDPQKPSGYDMNGAVAGLALITIRRPAETVMLFDGTGRWNGTGPIGSVECRHNRGANIGFVDGHVRWMGREEVAALDSQRLLPSQGLGSRPMSVPIPRPSPEAPYPGR